MQGVDEVSGRALGLRLGMNVLQDNEEWMRRLSLCWKGGRRKTLNDIAELVWNDQALRIAVRLSSQDGGRRKAGNKERNANEETYTPAASRTFG